MDKQLIEGDRLYLIAESLAQDFSLFPTTESEEPLPGLLPESQIVQQTEHLGSLDVDSYIEQVVAPAEDLGRMSAPEAVRRLGRVLEEVSDESFYAATVEMQFPDGEWRSVGFIAQDRSARNGVWLPAHHLEAANRVQSYAKRSLPIVTLMDTPGADAEEQANRDNQAHSISRLIAEMSNVDVPNVGIVFGLGYSGGAIPLAASNMILSVRDGVFSTIQPKSLANIARRLNLSWQECAKYVGLSPCELCVQGNIDGVVDYAPGEGSEQLENLRLAIVNGIARVEDKVIEFVAENPYILDHYRQSLQRYLNPSEQLKRMQDSALLKLTKNPTEYLNVFGVAYRYLRYLKVRQRIKATSTAQYGRLADQELPAGELSVRAERERRYTFIKWMQDPDKVVYDDGLSRAWKNYNDKKQAVHDERGRIAQLLFGEPKKNYEDARSNLISSVGVFLYNRWKSEALGNLRALKDVLHSPADVRQIVRVSDIPDPRALVRALRQDAVLLPQVRERFTHEGRKLLGDQGLVGASDAFLSTELTAQLNMCITGGALRDDADLGGRSAIEFNRTLFVERLPGLVAPVVDAGTPVPFSDMTVLDVLVGGELRKDFIAECENLVLFDSVYDQIIANLDAIAEEAQSERALSRQSLGSLIDTTLGFAAQGVTLERQQAGAEEPAQQVADRLRDQFIDWYLRVLTMARGGDFFRAVEEWKKTSFPHLSDTLFVVVTHLFESLLQSFVTAEREGKNYQGRIAPKNIGRRKDFWNRLNIAYRDLLIQDKLREFKNKKNSGYQEFIDTFVDEFEATDADLLSSDPCEFPGFRLSVEQALNRGVPPCGVVTGIGRFKSSGGGVRAGLVISNVAFQAGSFDMASAEKFCRLLVSCAEQHLPVICFISSGGMQTKEGAGALFSMAAVNDRITRFVRDHDLPVIVFGFGDCTGGAQASFVTHPLVQTYYFSGTSMPFAGQIVVPSNLPLNSILSNYLSIVPGAMQGLVQHPFQPELDEELRRIDKEIPVPQETVVDVVERVMSGVLSQQRPVVVAHRPRFTNADLVKPVRRVLIHARGCTAAKLIRIAQKNDIEVVLVQSDPDMESAPADLLGDRGTVVCIGGNTPDESYLNAMSVLSVAEHEGVDSLHPGIGFLSENSQFAELVRAHGINFIGPPVASMETMGNKSNAINTALRLKVPVVPGSHGILTNVDRAAEVAGQIGYPVLIKAVHGGGGKGIQVVENAGQFDELFHRVTVEARAAFGSGDVYLEKFVTSLRHIEAQLLRDSHGNAKVLGIRDCSVQRNKQKVIEESDSTMLPERLREEVLRHTAALADEVGYVGAGTVEFIYDLAADAVYFMEMNTRLQVEHPVTEWVSGIDIVSQQFRIAGGESIADLEPARNGYSIEARVTAERVQMGTSGELEFRPHPGEIVECEFPDDEGVEIIASAGAGKFVSPFYDSMIAQVVVHAEDRDAAADKLLEYLSRVRITGICTNIPLLNRILADEVFRKGDYDTEYLPGLLQRTDADQLIEEINAGAGEVAGGIDQDAIRIDDSDELKVLSPATAIFYTTPTPTEPPYVTVGDRISVGTTMGQLEAMKLFTPLSLLDFNTELELYDSSKEYEVTRINMSTGQQVNVGDLLFVVKPVDAAS
ncbi:MAG: carbamoyl-phosphate synthase large subunit [Gammaproteobacteria bacterium]|nr:carbamoyl-phosphate synthase large subunit [Gammaproteobacteria bacterium]